MAYIDQGSGTAIRGHQHAIHTCSRSQACTVRLGRRTSSPLLRYLRPFERSYGVLRSSTAQRAGPQPSNHPKALTHNPQPAGQADSTAAVPEPTAPRGRLYRYRFKDTGGSRDTHETDTRTSQTGIRVVSRVRRDKTGVYVNTSDATTGATALLLVCEEIVSTKQLEARKQGSKLLQASRVKQAISKIITVPTPGHTPRYTRTDEPHNHPNPPTHPRVETTQVPKQAQANTPVTNTPVTSTQQLACST